MSKFNPNDPKLWKDYDPFSTNENRDFVDGKDQTKVNRSVGSAFKKDNPIFRDTMKLVAEERGQEYLENLQYGIKHNRDNTYQAKTNARPEVQAKISNALTGKPKTEEHKQALKSTTTNRYGDANYEAVHKAGLAKRDKPFHAGEYGTFPSIAEAARQVEEQDLLKNAYKKFSKWKKDKPDEYYFITN